MKEHSVGFTLKQLSLVGDERKQALTALKRMHICVSTRVAPRDIQLSSLVTIWIKAINFVEMISFSMSITVTHVLIPLLLKVNIESYRFRILSQGAVQSIRR